MPKPRNEAANKPDKQPHLLGKAIKIVLRIQYIKQSNHEMPLTQRQRIEQTGPCDAKHSHYTERERRRESAPNQPCIACCQPLLVCRPAYR